MEPVRFSEPVDLNCDPRRKKGAKCDARLASVLMSREGRGGSGETAQSVHGEKYDTRNQEGREGRSLEQLERYSKALTSGVQRKPKAARHCTDANEHLQNSQSNGEGACHRWDCLHRERRTIGPGCLAAT